MGMKIQKNKKPSGKIKTKKPTKPTPQITIAPTIKESDKPTYHPTKYPTNHPVASPSKQTSSPTTKGTEQSNNSNTHNFFGGGSLGGDLLGAFIVFAVTGILLGISYKLYGPKSSSSYSQVNVASTMPETVSGNNYIYAPANQAGTNNQGPISFDYDFNPSQI